MGLNFTKHSSPPQCTLKQITSCYKREAWATDIEGGIWRYRLKDDEFEWTQVGDVKDAVMVSATCDASEVWYLATNSQVFSWDEELESWGAVSQTRPIKWLALGTYFLSLGLFA